MGGTMTTPQALDLARRIQAASDRPLSQRQSLRRALWLMAQATPPTDRPIAPYPENPNDEP